MRGVAAEALFVGNLGHTNIIDQNGGLALTYKGGFFFFFVHCNKKVSVLLKTLNL